MNLPSQTAWLLIVVSISRLRVSSNSSSFSHSRLLARGTQFFKDTGFRLSPVSTNFTTLALNTFIVCRQSFFILPANPFTGTLQKSLIFTWDTKSLENFESGASTNFATPANGDQTTAVKSEQKRVAIIAVSSIDASIEYSVFKSALC